MKPITVAITGASGSVYGIRLLEFLCSNDFAVDLILSETACKVLKLEMGMNLTFDSAKQNKETLLNHFTNKGLSNKHFDKLNLWSINNLAASVSSGSYRSEGMILIPCSMGTIGRIANGVSSDLISRCADVCLKERSKLILVARETPLSAIHLENMLKLTQAGAIILPAMPAFYHNPQSMEDLIDFVVGKTLDVFGIDHTLFERWMSKDKK